jgi:hypothetical protein
LDSPILVEIGLYTMYMNDFPTLYSDKASSSIFHSFVKYAVHIITRGFESGRPVVCIVSCSTSNRTPPCIDCTESNRFRKVVFAKVRSHLPRSKPLLNPSVIASVISFAALHPLLPPFSFFSPSPPNHPCTPAAHPPLVLLSAPGLCPSASS